MAMRTIAFRLNDKVKEDKEIMEWLDNVVYKNEFYDSITEAVKWAILSFTRGELRNHEEMELADTMQEFICDYAAQSKVDIEKLMQEAITRILAGVLSTMNMQAYGYAPASVQRVSQDISVTGSQSSASSLLEHETTEKGFALQCSDAPLDESAKESLASMFGDDEWDE